MTASGWREVDANLLRGAAPGSAEACAHAQDAGRQDLGDFIQALGRGHQIGAEGIGQLPRLFTNAKPSVRISHIIARIRKTSIYNGIAKYSENKSGSGNLFVIAFWNYVIAVKSWRLEPGKEIGTK
jgi:hypothetical protein